MRIIRPDARCQASAGKPFRSGMPGRKSIDAASVSAITGMFGRPSAYGLSRRPCTALVRLGPLGTTAAATNVPEPRCATRKPPLISRPSALRIVLRERPSIRARLRLDGIHRFATALRELLYAARGKAVPQAQSALRYESQD